MIEKVRYRLVLAYGPGDIGAAAPWVTAPSGIKVPSCPLIEAFRAGLEGIDPDAVQGLYIHFRFEDRAGVSWFKPMTCAVADMWSMTVHHADGKTIERPGRWAVIHRALNIAAVHTRKAEKVVPELGFLLVEFVVGEEVLVQDLPGGTRFDRDLEIG